MPKKKIKASFMRFVQKFRNLIFPQDIKCIFCKEELNNHSMNSTCEICLNSLPYIINSCPKCGGVLSTETMGVCFDCKRNNYSFEQAFSVFTYENSVLNAIHTLKYFGKKYLAKNFAYFMAQKIQTENISFDYITCVPMFKDKQKERGFNQSELIAEEISKLLNVEYLPMCKKVVNTSSQTQHTFSERKANVKNSFKFISNFKPYIKNKNVLIIDDVFTTGATCDELSNVILKAGANKCYVITLAHVCLNRS